MIAGQLARLGAGRGDLVPLLAGTSAESVHAWLGVNLARAADVPLNTAYRGASRAHGLGPCGPGVWDRTAAGVSVRALSREPGATQIACGPAGASQAGASQASTGQACEEHQ